MQYEITDEIDQNLFISTGSKTIIKFNDFCLLGTIKTNYDLIISFILENLVE